MKTRIKNIKSITSWSPKENKLKIINDTNIVIENEKIFYIGKNIFSVDKEIDANGALITPGFIDSHTHPIFYNNRSEEFFLRTKGISYDEISRGGGGILSSIKSVREVSEEKLFNRSLQRINYFLKNGTTTIEAKSGYGLNTKNELKLLSVIKKLNEVSYLDLVPTFMGAHAVPQEYNKDTYINLICNEMIPAIAEKQLAEYCDVFCENGYFSIEDSKKILLKAKEYGMNIRLHADEFEDSGAANLAAELSAISADHLMAVSDIGIKSLAKKNVIATILPGTTFFLGKQSYANGRKIIDLGCDICIATDYNPGSSTTQSMPLIIFLACLYCNINIEEAFKAATWNAARSLNRENIIGAISEGYQADILFWDLKNINEIAYWMNSDRLMKVMKKGKIINHESLEFD